MPERRCDRCEFWKGKDIHFRFGLSKDRVTRICKRFPEWKHTKKDHWCGEFKAESEETPEFCKDDCPFKIFKDA